MIGGQSAVGARRDVMEHDEQLPVRTSIVLVAFTPRIVGPPSLAAKVAGNSIACSFPPPARNHCINQRPTLSTQSVPTNEFPGVAKTSHLRKVHSEFLIMGFLFSRPKEEPRQNRPATEAERAELELKVAMTRLAKYSKNVRRHSSRCCTRITRPF